MTMVKIEFFVMGDELNPEDIIKDLSLVPCKSWKKGERMSEKGPVQDYGCCIFSSGERKNAPYAEEVMEEIIKQLEGKKNLLQNYVSEMDITLRFEIIIELEEGKVNPCLYFNSAILEFVNDIHAEIDVDLYVV